MAGLILAVHVTVLSDGVFADFTLRNEGPARHVRVAGTPLEPFADATVELRLGDRLLAYRGPAAVRELSEKDVRLVKPAGTLSQKLRLDSVFDITAAGDYSLSWDFSMVSWEGAVAGPPSPATLMHDRPRGTQRFRVDQPRPAVAVPLRVASKQSPKGTYEQPRAEAIELAKVAAAATAAPSPHFEAWFDAPDDADGVVRSNYMKTAEKLSVVTIVDAVCDHVAFVLRGTTGPIYVCGAFAATASAQDGVVTHTKASVLLHEAAHLAAGLVDGGGKDGPLCAWIQPNARAVMDAYALEYYAAWVPGRTPLGLKQACPPWP